MRLPTLSLIIASLAVIWCVAGAYVHTSTILLYPAAWIAIASAFYFHHKFFPIKLPAPNIPADETWANSRKNDDAENEQQPEKVTAD